LKILSQYADQLLQKICDLTVKENTVDLVNTLSGVILGFLLSFLGMWWRDRRHTGAEKRLLAGALASELRGFQEVCPREENAVRTWAVAQS